MAGSTNKTTKRQAPGALADYRDWIVNLIIHALIRAAGIFSYERRLALFSWLTRRVFGPVSGWKKRARANLAFIYPGMAADKRERLAEESLDNLGRAFMENYYVDEFRARIAGSPIGGPGAAELFAALAAGRPVIMVASHFGNYEAPRSALFLRGHAIGVIYRPASNSYFQRHYLGILENGGGPAFQAGDPTGPKFTDYLRDGGALILAHDLFYFGGEMLPFLGHDTRTATSAAGLAVRFDALLVPYFGIRQPNGCEFELYIDAPVPHSDPVAMTIALNQSLERQIAKRPGQWLWSHRRWLNLRRQGRTAAASTRPGPAS